MAEPAQAYETPIAPRIIKISSKRQITIPADMYEKSGFAEYAYAVWQDDGSIGISPIDVRDESESVKLLRALHARGLDGEDLINEYERIVHPVIDFKSAIEQSLKDAAEGRTAAFDGMQSRLRQKYGL